MEIASKLLRTLPRSRWTCSQCRRASNVTEPRYSAKKATSSMADELLRPLRTASPRLAQQQESLPDALTGVLEPQKSREDAQKRKPRRRGPSMLDIAEARSRQHRVQQANGKDYTGQDLERQMNRRFESGDVYSPHDLTGVEQSKWAFTRAKPRTKIDVADRLGIDFMKEYKNFGMMQEFLTSGGRILPGTKTGLRPKNQRKLARAVRRAAGLGLIPRTYMHPEMLKRARR